MSSLHEAALARLHEFKWRLPEQLVTVTRDPSGDLSQVVVSAQHEQTELQLHHHFDLATTTSSCTAVARHETTELFRASTTIEWKSDTLAFAASVPGGSSDAFAVLLYEGKATHEAPILVLPQVPIGRGGKLDLQTGIPTIDLAPAKRLPGSTSWLGTAMGNVLIAEDARLQAHATKSITTYANLDLATPLASVYWTHIVHDELTMGSIYSMAELGVLCSTDATDTAATRALMGVLWRVCALDFEPTFISKLSAGGRPGGMPQAIDPKTLAKKKTDD